MINKPKDQVWINLGCGISFFKDFINVDKYVDMEDIRARLKKKDPVLVNAFIEEGAKFVKADVLNLPFKDNSVDYIETVDMIEHVSHWDVQKAFNEMYRVLKVGGTLKLMTVSFDNIANMWCQWIAGKDFRECADAYHNLNEIIFGNQLHEGEHHKVAFNPSYLNYLLCMAGWYNIKIVVYPYGSTAFPDLNSNASPHMMFSKNSMHRQDSIFVEVIK